MAHGGGKLSEERLTVSPIGKSSGNCIVVVVIGIAKHLQSSHPVDNAHISPYKQNQRLQTGAQHLRVAEVKGKAVSPGLLGRCYRSASKQQYFSEQNKMRAVRHV